MTALIPTPEQASIIEAMASPEPLLIEAYAGTAKTSTLAMAAPRRKEPALALAFNKRIAEELKPRLPGNWRVMTLNGLGHLAWLRALPAGVKVQLDDRKLGKLVSQVARSSRAELSSDQWDQTRRLVSAAMQAGVAPQGGGAAPGALAPDTPETWSALAQDCWIAAEDTGLLVDLARSVLLDSVTLARQGIISFDDQIYCPTVLGGAWLKFPCAAVDEAQDLSPLNHQMLALATRPDAKIVAVGDSRQAIYAFRGADSASLQTLAAMRPDWIQRQLTMTFRCPRVIVARQQAHAPGFRAADSAPQGLFAELVRLDKGWDFAQLASLAPNLDHDYFNPRFPSLAVLCRNNAPLLSLAFRLLRQRIVPQMLGRDIGKGLRALAKKLAGARGRSEAPDLPIDLFLGRLSEWEARERSLALANGHEAQADSIFDRAASLRAVADGAECQRTSDLLDALDHLFSRESADVTLSTIHRAKGLEWDLVCHLDPWRIPSRQAKTAASRGNPGPLQQEANLRYVCETRTRHTLVQANLEDFQ